MSELSSLSIKDFPNWYVRPLPFSCHTKKNWSFMDHLSRTPPNEKIFDLLRYSIRSGSLMHHCPAKLKFDMLKVIITWLEVSFRECNRHLETPPTNNPICSRDLVPSDRATCTITSRVNFKFFRVSRHPKEKSPSTWTDRLSIITKSFFFFFFFFLFSFFGA